MNSAADLFNTETWHVLKQEQERTNSQRIARQRKKRELIEDLQAQLAAAGISIDDFLESSKIDA
ncbi:H-NS family histone-like protein [Deefgea rivuli]|uniref:H-NS family histone-like protein n=1 Tax=Deefgea rivuli TaxID=400948 RepID=UPI000489E733